MVEFFIGGGKKRKQKVFVHIGYPKTASSYLQQRLFRSHPQINYPLLNPEFAQFIYDLSFTNKPDDTIDEIKQKGFGGYILKDKVNVISSEGITDPDKLLPRGGAKNHLVVVPDADVKLTADNVVASAFGGAGQRCMAASVMMAVGDVQKIVDADVLPFWFFEEMAWR